MATVAARQRRDRRTLAASGVRAPEGLRVLTAAARRIDMTNRSEAKQLRALMQGWQADAWNYRDSVTELRYAIEFKANALSRMRLFVGVETGDEDEPVVPLSKDETIPDNVKSIAFQALNDLAPSKGALREMLRSLSNQIDVPGECRILGRTDPETRQEEWSVRSLDEVVMKDDGYELREIPDGPQGIIPWVKLDPELTVISRVWMPHPRFKLLADSPLRAMLPECETLLILRRMVRSEGRSRLNRGLLAVPDELSIKGQLDDDEDPEADPFMANLAKALMEPIGDEGTASAYVPITIKGPADALKELRRIVITDPFDPHLMKREEMQVGIIATGFDLPKEVITGIADINHWGAWQVDDSTFRHHLEPHTIKSVDALTAGYFRPRLVSLDVPLSYARRLCVWYDPTELVTHPDQTKDALQLYDRHAISASALAKVAGFGEKDEPSAEEIILRLLMNMRTPPANVVMAAIHQLSPALVIPPINTSGTVPGVSASGVEEVETPAEGLPEEQPAELGGTPGLPEPEASAPSAGVPSGPPPSAVTASGRQAHRLSRRLAAIDRDLRTRLVTAANAQMLRQLERAGAKVRASKTVRGNPELHASVAGVSNELVPTTVGRDVLIAAGLPKLDDWAGLRGQFMEWTAAAQKRALATAIQIGGLAGEADAVKGAEAAQILGLEKAWQWTQDALTSLGDGLLSAEDLNPDTLVPTGLIRGALGIAGGGDYAPDPSGKDMAVGEPIGQIGTGATVTELLEGAGMEAAQYEWEHSSMAINPFEPHLNLDGVQFDSFEDPALANTEGFPANAYFLPGDHAGCGCDVVPLYQQAESGEPEQAEGGEGE